MTLTSVLSPFVLLPQQFLGSSSQVWGHKLTLMGLLALVAAGGCLIGAWLHGIPRMTTWDTRIPPKVWAFTLPLQNHGDGFDNLWLSDSIPFQSWCMTIFGWCARCAKRRQHGVEMFAVGCVWKLGMPPKNGNLTRETDDQLYHWILEDFGVSHFHFQSFVSWNFGNPIQRISAGSVRLHPFVSSTFGEKAFGLKAWDAVACGVKASGSIWVYAKTIELIMLWSILGNIISWNASFEKISWKIKCPLCKLPCISCPEVCGLLFFLQELKLLCPFWTTNRVSPGKRA